MTARMVYEDDATGLTSPFRERDAMLVSLIAYAGLRPEEALALTWENVKPTTIRVEHANANGKIDRTKTEQRRTVKPLIPTLVDDLEAWRATLVAQKQPERYRKALGKPKPDDLVIGQPDGSPWTTADYGNFRRRVFGKHLPADAHAEARPYDLRHGYGSLLIRQGEDIPTVAKRMGNSSTTVLAHYSHVFDDADGQRLRNMAEAVAAARVSRGHSKDTSARETEGHEGLPLAA